MRLFMISKRKWNRLWLKKKLLKKYRNDFDKNRNSYIIWSKRRKLSLKSGLDNIDWDERRESGRMVLFLINEAVRLNKTMKRIDVFLDKSS